jgi:hypothetical protein
LDGQGIRMMPCETFRFLIVIPHRNGHGLLDSTVRHALAACGPRDLVVVVDNASSDGSAQAVSDSFPAVRLIQNARNAGFAAACNQGAACAETRYLLFLNSDAHISMDLLGVLAAHFESHPRVGQIGLQLTSQDGALQRSTMPQPNLWTELGFRKRIPRGYRDPQVTASVEALVGACVAMPAKVFSSLGGWCEDFFFYGEDLDLSRRIRAAGLEVVFRPDLRAVHERGSSTATVRLPAQLEHLRSRLTFARKHFGAWFWLILPARVLSVLLNASGAAIALLMTLGLHAGLRMRAWRFLLTIAWLAFLMRPGWSLSGLSRLEEAAGGHVCGRQQPRPRA